jgi:hypothetical protein
MALFINDGPSVSMHRLLPNNLRDKSSTNLTAFHLNYTTDTSEAWDPNTTAWSNLITSEF